MTVTVTVGRPCHGHGGSGCHGDPDSDDHESELDARATLSISGDDGDGSDGDGENDLPARSNLNDLVDFVKPIDSTPSVSVDIDMKKNTFFSNRTYVLYGNGKILVTGKDQMVEFNGSTVLHY